MAEIETALAALEDRVAEAQKSSDGLSSTLRRLRKAVVEGQVNEIEKGLQTIVERGQQAEAAARSLSGAWTFDARAHLAGNYGSELREEAARQGLEMFERDGRFYAFPLILRVDARDTAIRVGKKAVRTLRPKHLVKLIAAAQKRPLRLREERFLALLYDVYGELGGESWEKTRNGPGPAVSLAAMHRSLTRLPGSDYPIEEFGRDLLLLDRRPDLRTRDGASFDFQGSALARGGMKRISVYDEHGNERTYIAIRFLKDR